jgi:hypothetical protein
MTRIEYDLLRAERPQMRLPHWTWLTDAGKQRFRRHSRQSFEARYLAYLLAYGPIAVFENFWDF